MATSPPTSRPGTSRSPRWSRRGDLRQDLDRPTPNRRDPGSAPRAWGHAPDHLASRLIPRARAAPVLGTVPPPCTRGSAISFLPCSGKLLADAGWAETRRAPHGAKLAPFSCPLSGRIPGDPPAVDSGSHPAERPLGLGVRSWRTLVMPTCDQRSRSAEPSARPKALSMESSSHKYGTCGWGESWPILPRWLARQRLCSPCRQALRCDQKG